jgi:hypothetical protein
MNISPQLQQVLQNGVAHPAQGGQVIPVGANPGQPPQPGGQPMPGQPPMQPGQGQPQLPPGASAMLGGQAGNMMNNPSVDPHTKTIIQSVIMRLMALM